MARNGGKMAKRKICVLFKFPDFKWKMGQIFEAFSEYLNFTTFGRLFLEPTLVQIQSTRTKHGHPLVNVLSVRLWSFFFGVTQIPRVVTHFITCTNNFYYGHFLVIWKLEISTLFSKISSNCYANSQNTKIFFQAYSFWS